MPFELVIDRDEMFLGLSKYKWEGITADPGDIADAINFSIQDVMKEYRKRVNDLTRYWKEGNKPIFSSNFTTVGNFSLQNLENRPVEFTLTNTKIWGLVSAGSPPHVIESKGNYPLKFTGWSSLTPRQNRASFQALHPRQRGSKVSGAFTYAARQRQQIYGKEIRTTRHQVDRRNLQNRSSSRSFSRSPYSILPSAVDIISATRRSYPPTYIPSTKPLLYSSNPSQHLGNAKVLIRGPGRLANEVYYVQEGPARVHHPGFEARNLTGMLLGTHGKVSGGMLDSLFVDLVYARLGSEDDDIPRRFRLQRRNFASDRYLRQLL